MTLRHRATITWASPPTFQSLVLAVALGIFCTEFASANFEHLPTPLGPDSLSEAVMHEQIRLHMRSAQPSNARSLWRGCGERLSHLTEVRTEERKQSDSGRNGGTDKDLLRQRAFYERDVELCWETWRGGIPDGHLVEVSVAGETVELDYDEFGRLVTLTRLDTRTNEQPRITHYRYGPARTVEIDGPREDVADLLWLALDDDWQVLESTNALGQRFLFEYDEQRRRAAVTDPNGIRRWFGFDERDRVVSQTVGSGEGGTAILRQGFDASGNLLWNQRRGQGVVRREYGEEGRILGLWEEGGEAVGFHYDQSGRFAGTSRLSSREELGTGAAPPATLRELSPDRSSPSPPAPSDGGPGNWNGHIRPLKFDLLSRILISEDSQGRTTHYEYNGFGELIAKQGPTGNFRFAYDENGNMVWEHQPDGTETRREFDALNRLARVTTSSSDGSSTEHRFAYDGCENGLGKLCEASGSSQTKRFQYDTLGNLASVHSMFVPLTKSPWAPADWQGTLSKESPNDRNGEGGGGYLDSGGATRSSTLMKIYYCEFNCQGTPIYTLVDEDLAWNAGFRSYLRSDSFDYGDMVCVNLVDPSPPPPPVIVFLPSRPASISITTSPSTLLIDRHLNMPSVTFEANVDPGSSAPNSFQAAYEWYKEIKFRRGARNYTNRFPARGMVSTGSTRRWTPDWGSFLRGGNDVTVHVKVTLTESGGADPSTITLSDTQTGFQIHGQNPTQSQIFAIATKAEYKAVAWQESTHRQFVGIRYTGVGLPLWGAPDGWGLMQLELNTPGRNWGENEIWKWDKNLREGAQYLEDIYSQALGYLIERHRLDSLRDPPIIWSTNPANEPDSVWDDTFARYNTGDSIYYPSGNGGVRNCAKRAAGCNYADRVRGHINRPPW